MIFRKGVIEGVVDINRIGNMSLSSWKGVKFEKIVNCSSKRIFSQISDLLRFSFIFDLLP